MNIKVVDFEILSKHYVKYQEGITEIENVKKEFVKRLDPFKDEMQALIKGNPSQTEEEQKVSGERFQELQEMAMSIDEEFKYKMRQMNDELSKGIYTDLENIISEWGTENEVDMVIGSTEVVFLNQKHNVTNSIINILKENGTYIEEPTRGQVILPTN